MIAKFGENSENKIIREMDKGINEFKKGYQPHAYAIKKDEGTIGAGLQERNTQMLDGTTVE